MSDTFGRSNVIDLDKERARRRSPEASPPTSSEDSPSYVEILREARQRMTQSVPDLDWNLSQRGNPYVVVNEAFHVVLFRRSGAWAFRIENLETGQAWCSERRYQTEDAARCDALLAVSQLQQKTPERKA